MAMGTGFSPMVAHLRPPRSLLPDGHAAGEGDLRRLSLHHGPTRTVAGKTPRAPWAWVMLLHVQDHFYSTSLLLVFCSGLGIF